LQLAPHEFFIILLLAGSGFCLKAQTNAPATNSLPSQTDITSDRGENSTAFTHQMFYMGHVVVIDPKAKLWCETSHGEFAAGGRASPPTSWP